jgi:hypothetical protein
MVAPEETLNPAPFTWYVPPTGPWRGLRVIVGVVTVNVPVAVCPPVFVAITELPDVPLGTWKEQLKDPEALVLSEPVEQLVTDTASKTSDRSVVEFEKPVPETVTSAPTGPCEGFTVIEPIEKATEIPTAAPLTVKFGSNDGA